MHKISVSFDGVGPHTVIASVAGEKILPYSLYLTFSHSQPRAQPVTVLGGTRVLLGPYQMIDGGIFEWERTDAETLTVLAGEAFILNIPANVICSGTVEYEIGAW